MKTVFVVNPVAGQGSKTERCLASIREALHKTKKEGEIYLTKKVGDATEFVWDYCKDKGAARFFACGGDGTLSEVLNGASHCPEAEIGVVPMGTGNDFCRNFGEKYNFLDLVSQLEGEAVSCDAIHYRTWVRDDVKEGYCVNMFNIGFDCNVADLTAEMKKKPFLSGSFAYFVSILMSLIQKKTANLTIKLDGVLRHQGKLLLTSIANGSFCGGGIKSNPLASVSDGRMNINMIQNLSRLKFLSLLPAYMKGTVLEQKGAEGFIQSVHGQKVELTPLDGTLRLCVDGEIMDAGKTEFEVVPSMFRFVLPAVEVNQKEEAILVV